MNIRIGVCGPIDLTILNWDLPSDSLPVTNAFPLTSHFINALVKRGFKVTGYTNSPVIDKPMVLESGNLKICISPTKPQPGRRFFRYEIDELEKMIVAHPSDFISAFWSYEYALAALRTNIPVAVGLHDVAFKILQNEPDMFRLVRWMLNYQAVTKAKHLIANSAYTYQLLNKSEKAKAVTIDNFYTEDIVRFSGEITGKGNYIISVVQGFTNRKNIKRSLHAFANLRKRFPELEYRLIGVDMEENGRAHQYASQHQLTEGVRFIGPQPFEEVIKHTAGALLLVHPSLEESFGMAVLEAMVAGTPVVGGKKSGFVPYLLDHGNTGILCDVTSIEEMTNAMFTLLEDENLRNSLIKKAKAFAHTNFSEDVIIDKHLNYYSKILGKQLTPTLPNNNERLQESPERRLRA